MTAREEIAGHYASYFGEVERLRQNGKATDGLLGLGGGPASDGCQDRFAEQAQAAFRNLSGRGLPPEELREVLEYAYRIPLDYREDQVVYWMLLAVQGATLPLVEALAAGDAAALAEAYRRDYPRFTRLPVQKQVLTALKNRAKGR